MGGLVHFILDSVKSILEHEYIFKPVALYSILAQLENNEVDKAVARLVVQMVRGLEGVSLPEVTSWYEKHRNSVPKYLREDAEGQEEQGVPLLSESVCCDHHAAGQQTEQPGLPTSVVTFVTEPGE